VYLRFGKDFYVKVWFGASLLSVSGFCKARIFIFKVMCVPVL